MITVEPGAVKDSRDYIFIPLSKGKGPDDLSEPFAFQLLYNRRLTSR
jgi:hypothetical protein